MLEIKYLWRLKGEHAAWVYRVSYESAGPRLGKSPPHEKSERYESHGYFWGRLSWLAMVARHVWCKTGLKAKYAEIMLNTNVD